jgi:hypothetical protein
MKAYLICFLFTDVRQNIAGNLILHVNDLHVSNLLFIHVLKLPLIFSLPLHTVVLRPKYVCYVIQINKLIIHYVN